MTEEQTTEVAPAATAPAEPAAPVEPTAPAPTDYFGRALAALEGAIAEPVVDAPSAPEVPADPDQGETPTPTPGEQPEGTTPEPVVDTEAINSAHFAALAAEQARLAQERTAFDARQQAAAPGLEALERARQAAGTDVIQALQELGLDYSEITKRVLANPAAAKPAEPAKPDPLRKEVDELRTQLETYQRESITTQIASAARTAVEGGEDAARWELLKQEPGYDRQVVDYIERAWQANGAPTDQQGRPVGALTLEQAADKLETYLFTQATKYSNATKVRAHYAPATEQEPPPPESAPSAIPGATTPPAIVPAATTLTTSHAATAARSDRTGDADACRARALAVLESAYDD